MDATLKITGGIYLVLDPAMDKIRLLNKLSAALATGIQVVQIWNNWPEGADKLGWIEDVAELCKFRQVPLLINEDWDLLTRSSHLQGVHFDHIPASFDSIKQTVGRPFLTGITCSGDLQTVVWANTHHCDYISFCAMFPSASVQSCDIVMPATVRQARTLTPIPLFVSGGITPENIVSLRKETPFDGVAVISGILSAEDPQQKVQQYKDALGINF